MESVLEGVCAVCQIPAKHICAACKLVYYCSSDHQRQHWKQIHKKECCPFVLADNENLGRHLLAKSHISEGQIIFVEEPLVVAPKWFLSEEERLSPVVPCVGCYKPCSLQGSFCPKCHWPVCAANCSGLQDSNFHGTECEILAFGSPPRNSDERTLLDYYRPDALLVLKCLLLQLVKPEKWTQLMNMQSHEEDRLGSQLQKDAEERIVSYLQNQYFQRFEKKRKSVKQKFSIEYNNQLLHRICGIIETNYMCISLPDKYELSGLFYNACMMEHSCEPNCYFQFNQHRGYRIAVVAGRNIKSGEHLCIMYTNMLWATHMRQEHLTLTKHFVCSCKRCQDPTELGSYFAALRCTKNIGSKEILCNGVLLPVEPLNTKTSWSCIKCEVVMNTQQVQYLLTQITEEMEDFMAQKHSVMEVEQMLLKLSEWLHPHHYHIFSLKHLLIQLYGNVEGYKSNQMDNHTLNRKLQLCEELYDICQKIDPHTIRLSLYVAVILYELASVLTEYINRSNLSTTLNERSTMLNAAHTKLSKALQILKKEQDNISGRKMTEKILKVLQAISINMNSLDKPL